MPDKRTILIIDDEKPIVSFLAKAFERLDFRVLKSYDGEDALVTALEYRPDIIVLDILLPKLDGIEVLKALKAPSCACKDTPVVVLSARDRLSQIREALDAGASEYLCKPVFSEDLVKMVLRFLQR